MVGLKDFKCYSHQSLFRADKCQEARKQTQGIVLFGSKIKVTPLDFDGMCIACMTCANRCTYILTDMFVAVQTFPLVGGTSPVSHRLETGH